MRTAFAERFWDDGSGRYLDFDLHAQTQIDENTIATFSPLFAGLPTQEQAQRLVEHLTNPAEYWPGPDAPQFPRAHHEQAQPLLGPDSLLARPGVGQHQLGTDPRDSSDMASSRRPTGCVTTLSACSLPSRTAMSGGSGSTSTPRTATCTGSTGSAVGGPRGSS